jgi:hypothetical protein
MVDPSGSAIASSMLALPIYVQEILINIRKDAAMRIPLRINLCCA